MGAFVISPLPRLAERNAHRSGPFPPGAFGGTPLDSTTTRSATLMPRPALPTRGDSEPLFAGHQGLLPFPHHPSHPVAADTPPVRTAASDSFRLVLAAFARDRPSQPPEKRVTRLPLRSLHVATWCVATLLSSLLSEGSVVLLSRHDASLATRLESFRPGWS